MDQPEPQNPASTIKPEQTEQNTEKVKIKKKFAPKKLFSFLLILLLMAGSAYGGYYYRDKSADKDSQKHSAEMTTLKKKVEPLESASNADKDADEGDTPVSSDDDAPVSPTAEQLTNIEESITSGNTAALEGRMASSVTVILAASEGLGERTESEAIADLAYVVDATASWNFDLSATKLEEFASGDYAQYFPEGALVGKSTTDKVVSFIFDADAKIKTIFMSASSDIL